ncbi:DUF1642 domain-containing protein [Enterococcus lactis]|uniref:DUF1642 domain-containing protein n=1 Tax=Enterococcus lactis TaxID=357441 RepID=UPI0022E44D24|nr:DUF1642 domain-containing protein [Enterococcus lactis]
MNKQEAIKKLESIKVIGNDALAACYNESINAGITLMKKIDEPQKAIAQLAEKWHEDIGPVLWWDFPVEEPPYCGTPLDDDFPKYKTHFTELRIPDEVEKEPLYYVKLKIPGATYYLIQTFLMPGDTHMCFSAATERYGAKWKNTFTEAEIKEIDERYWPFAVPVDEVEG